MVIVTLSAGMGGGTADWVQGDGASAVMSAGHVKVGADRRWATKQRKIKNKMISMFTE